MNTNIDNFSFSPDPTSLHNVKIGELLKEDLGHMRQFQGKVMSGGSRIAKVLLGYDLNDAQLSKVICPQLQYQATAEQVRRGKILLDKCFCAHTWINVTRFLCLSRSYSVCVPAALGGLAAWRHNNNEERIYGHT